MAGSAIILDFLIVVMVLFIIGFAIMFIGYKRLAHREQAKIHRDRTDPMNEDVGSSSEDIRLR